MIELPSKEIVGRRRARGQPAPARQRESDAVRSVCVSSSLAGRWLVQDFPSSVAFAACSPLLGGQTVEMLMCMHG